MQYDFDQNICDWILIILHLAKISIMLNGKAT